MRWAVLGAGAVGQLAAWRLARVAAAPPLLVRPRSWDKLTGSDASFDVRWVSGERESRTFPIIDGVGNACKAADALLVTTKSHQTLPAFNIPTDPVKIPVSTTIVLMQNGMGSHEGLREAYPDNVLILGSTTSGAYLTAPRTLVHGGTGETVFGVFPRRSKSVDAEEEKQLNAVVSEFASSGFGGRIEPNIVGRLWAKVGVNSSINALTALLNCPNGHIEALGDESRALIEQVCHEVVAVASANGQALDHTKLVELVYRVISDTRSNTSSTLQDIRNGRPSENDYISGYIVDRGRRSGIPTPVCETIWRLIRCTEQLKTMT